MAKVAGDGTEGTLTLSGEEYAFSLAPAEGDEAGLYRAEETIDGAEYVGGWILLSDGEQRGAIKRGTKTAGGSSLQKSAEGTEK